MFFLIHVKELLGVPPAGHLSAQEEECGGMVASYELEECQVVVLGLP